MRKPVRSTVANRKYFQGGGLAPMKPSAPEEAVGIMASSQPLVDMVAQSAGNPQGDMSPLNFDQGGLANVPVPEGRTRSRFGDLDLKLGKAFKDFYTLQGLRNPQGKLNFDLYDVIPGGYGLKTGIQSLFTKDALEKSFSVGQLGAVNLLIRNNPDKDPRKIMETAYKVYNENPNYGKEIDDKLQQAIDQLGKSPEKLALEQTQGEKLLKETEESKNKLQPFLREGSGKIEKPDGKITKVDDFSEGDGIKQLKKEEKLESDKIPEKDLQKIEEKGGALAKSLLEKEQEQTKKEVEEQAKKEAETDIENVAIPGGKDASDKNIETEEFTFPFGRQSLEKEKDVINQNTNPDAEQTSEDRLAMLMKRFTDAAPKYEGVDTGLALMQMGAIMAGGTSPNAIKNIADALTVTSEKLIKDKSKRDAFNRQVQLSALQYGLGEISKDEAQLRADRRKFTNFVVAEDAKPITWKGETYQPGETIRVSDEDYFNAGSKLPPGLQDASIYTANASAIAAKLNSANKLSNKLFELKFIKDPARQKFQSDYKAAVDGASTAETTASLIESVILRAPKITGGKATGKSIGANFLAAFNMPAPDSWNEKALAKTDLKAALQGVVKTTLGKTQSANSISDRDVDLLIQGFLADGIISKNKDGTFDFSLTMTQPKILINSLQNGLKAVRKAQAGFLNEMTQIERDLVGRYTVQGGAGADIISQYQKQKETAGFGTTLTEETAKKFKDPYILKDGIYEPV